MTREEALGKKGDESLERAGINGLVNDIYDYFEGRNCNSCKHYIDGGCGNIIEYCMFPLPKDFCCNKYKPKESNND